MLGALHVLKFDVGFLAFIGLGGGGIALVAAAVIVGVLAVPIMIMKNNNIAAAEESYFTTRQEFLEEPPSFDRMEEYLDVIDGENKRAEKINADLGWIRLSLERSCDELNGDFASSKSEEICNEVLSNKELSSQNN